MRPHPDNSSPSAASPAAQVLTRVCAILEACQDGKPLPKQSDSESGPLLHNILLCICRHRASLDFLLDTFRTGKLRPRIRRVLWWALAEMLWLDGLPVPVIVDTAITFIKRRYSLADASFSNALLRKIALLQEQDRLADLLSQAPAAVRLELPEVLYQRWAKTFAPAALAKLAELLQQPAEIILRARKNGLGEIIPAGLQELSAPPWAGDCRLFRLGKAKLAEILSTGEDFYVQDPSTLLAPAMLAVRPGEQVGDLCSAPGGKALFLAEHLDGEGRLICRDRSEARLGRVRENLRFWTNVEIAHGDARQPDLPPGSLDALLLDVPCSNTGVIRRRPDVRWTFKEKKLRELVELQRQILTSTAPLLRPGGRLVYSTCSLEEEENHLQVQDFLGRRADYVLLSQRQLPITSEHDGAYSALLQRK